VYGNLTFICGPMFGGKTTELLKRILWARNGCSKAVLVLKPAFDNRYSETKIVSHDGLSVESKSISSFSEVRALLDDAEMICIDETQFFTSPHFQDDLIEWISKFLEDGKEVVATGLDMDWQGKPFDISAKLAAMADDVIKVKANCTICGTPAAKTFKKVQNGEQIELGTTDLYEARCNKHWV